MSDEIEQDEEIELIARLFHVATNTNPNLQIEEIPWPPHYNSTYKRYINRARYVRDELKARGWTSP